MIKHTEVSNLPKGEGLGLGKYLHPDKKKIKITVKINYLGKYQVMQTNQSRDTHNLMISL